MHRRIRRLAALLTALVMLGGIADCDPFTRALAQEMEIAQDIPLEELPAGESPEETEDEGEAAPPRESFAAEMPVEDDAEAIPEETEEISPEEIIPEEIAPEGLLPEESPAPTQEPAVDITLEPEITPAPTPEPDRGPLVYTFSVRTVRDPLAQLALPIIISNEGSYSAVNADDNGALSIGKIQWHAGRALTLMRRIVALNPEQAMDILGEALYDEITSSSTKWNTRVVNSEEKALLSQLLATPESKYAQDEQALDDVSGYLQHGREKGIISNGALIYFADVENQNGAGGSGRIANTAIANAGSAEAVTLEIIHETALADEKVGRYAARRNRTYNKIVALGLEENVPSTGEGISITGVNYPSTYVISNAGYTVKSGTITSDAELKRLTIDIQDSKGKSITGMPRTWSLSGKSRSLSAFDNEIPFSKIKEPGDYIWIITAEDEKGRTAEVKYSFTAVLEDSGSDSPDDPEPVVTVSGIKLSKTKLNLEVGDAAAITAEVLPDDAADKGLIWSSSDASVASVSGGLVLAEGPGSAEIICKSRDGGAQAVCSVNVRLLPEKMEIIVPEGYLGLGEDVPLQVKFSPEGSSAELKWSSSNTKYVTVDQNGVVSGKKTGNATVTVKSENGLKDTIKVKVVNPKTAISVKIDGGETFILNIGETAQLNAQLTPATAQTQLKWSTSSSRYVKVKQDGSIYGARTGTATITVQTANGKKDTIKVKVVDPTKASAVVLDQSGTVLLELGENLQLNASVEPATAETALKWTSSNTSKVRVDQDGLVTARKTGTATITVRTNNGKTDTVKIKVYDPAKPASIRLEEEDVVVIEVGGEYALTANVFPETADVKLKWSSKSTRYARVDQNGVVTGVRKGTTTITVETQNGLKDTVKVKVVKAST